MMICHISTLIRDSDIINKFQINLVSQMQVTDCQPCMHIYMYEQLYPHIIFGIADNM